MLTQILEMVVHSIRDPKAGATRVLALQLDRTVLWLMMVLVVILSVILTQLAGLIAPGMTAAPPLLPKAPLLLSLVMFAGLYLMVLATHFVGRGFGGTGSFDDSLRIVIWLQIILVALQVVQVVLLMISPILAVLSGYVVALLGLWLLVNFIAAAHGFTSLPYVLGGVLLSLLGLGFGLSILITLMALFLGIDIQNV